MIETAQDAAIEVEEEIQTEEQLISGNVTLDGQEYNLEDINGETVFDYKKTKGEVTSFSF